MKNNFFISLTLVFIASLQNVALAEDLIVENFDREVATTVIGSDDEIQGKKVKIYCGEKLIGTVDGDINIFSGSVTSSIPKSLYTKIADCNELLRYSVVD